MNSHAKRSKHSLNLDGLPESDLGGSNQVVQNDPGGDAERTGRSMACTEDLSGLIKTGFLSLEKRLNLLSSQVDALSSQVAMLARHNTALTTNPSPSMPASSESGKLGGQPAQLLSIDNDQTDTESCGIPGVPYDRSYVRGLGNNSTSIAGALGLSKTSEVWALFLHDSSTKPLLEQYINARKRISSTQYNTLQSKIMAILWTDFKLRQLMRGDMPPTEASMGVKLSTYCSILTGWYANQVMKAKPLLFPSSRSLTSRDDDNDIRMDPCDWLHAWKLLALFWKFRGIMDMPHYADLDTPIKPVYHSDPGTFGALHLGGRMTEDMEIAEAQNQIVVDANFLFQ